MATTRTAARTRCSTSLLPLKVLLLSYYGGLGCVYPFLTVHLRSLELTWQDARLLPACLPLLTLLGLPVAAALIDKFGALKAVLVPCIVLSSAAYTSLLLVPSLARGPSLPPELQLRCGADGSAIVSQKCGPTCKLPSGAAQQTYRVHSCSRGCEPAPDASPYEPMCLLGSRDGECYVMPIGPSANGSTGEMEIGSFLPRHYEHAPRSCIYPLLRFSYRQREYSSLKCSGKADCPLRCQVDALLPEGALHNNTCPDLRGNVPLTFWMYSFIRGGAEVFGAVATYALDPVILRMVSAHGSTYGRHLLWGLLGLALFGPLCGYLIDHHFENFRILDFAPLFYAFDVLMLVSVILIFVVPLRKDPSFAGAAATSWREMLSSAGGSPRLWLLYLAALTVGTLHGCFRSHVYWFLQDLGASKLVLGLTLTAAALPSLPFMFCSHRVIGFCGTVNVFAIGMLLYSLRFIGYAFMSNPWHSLLFETFDVFCLFVLWTAAVNFVRVNCPQQLVATPLAVLHAAHFGLGRGLGGLAGNHVIQRFGFRQLWQGAAIVSLGTSIVVLIAYHAFLKIHHLRKKRSFRATDPGKAVPYECLKLTIPVPQPANYVG